ncbi:DUF429 domain-containing protein [Rhizobium mayense]|uniref:DUF429 domain-containing protein n=1 Tax=Rhizobium mayense TaxID=1312184 RepID=A0ABT7JQ09_9HYPH|nr:DUF429 domain-containing protein [Rhizobium mayense]MDL2398429.1 DUF429 domain-containing protein [Rhizobium mayense]
MFKEHSRWHTVEEFEIALSSPGPWIAGIDFPFGQARRFVENIGWPRIWEDYVRLVGTLSKPEFRDTLEEYKRDRPYGDKEHRRETDVVARSISPQKLYGVPVALMFYEGAPRLLNAAVTIPGLRTGDPQRIVVEAYPGVLARQLIGKRAYKHDNPKFQSSEHYEARTEMMEMIVSGYLKSSHGVEVEAPMELADDPSGDDLDALMCAIQAAWAWNMRSENYGMPRDHDGLEGWIADPKACGTGVRPTISKILPARPTPKWDTPKETIAMRCAVKPNSSPHQDFSETQISEPPEIAKISSKRPFMERLGFLIGNYIRRFR